MYVETLQNDLRRLNGMLHRLDVDSAEWNIVARARRSLFEFYVAIDRDLRALLNDKDPVSVICIF
jgi:hypothetical protein